MSFAATSFAAMSFAAPSRDKQEQAAVFDWPEPLVIEIVAERYRDILDERDRVALARQQGAALRELVAGRGRPAAALRLELIAACAARGVSAERIARADRAVFRELSQIAAARFRTSPRARAEILARLEAASRQLRTVSAAPTGPRTAATRLLRPAAAIG